MLCRKPASAETELEPLVSALDCIADLPLDDKIALLDLPFERVDFGREEAVLAPRTMDRPLAVVCHGLVCRQKTFSSGQRQILSFHFPGELPNVQTLQLDKLDFGLTALAASRVAFVARDVIAELLARRPAILQALWKATIVDNAIACVRMAQLGRRSALERSAHLLCELFFRMNARGASAGRNVRIPLTQTHLGDALGMTTVHMNRQLQHLKRDRLVSIERHDFRMLDWDGLRRLADFNPEYLHLKQPVTKTVESTLVL
jgi:CRP-like cAMP-binding protein